MAIEGANALDGLNALRNEPRCEVEFSIARRVQERHQQAECKAQFSLLNEVRKSGSGFIEGVFPMTIAGRIGGMRPRLVTLQVLDGPFSQLSEVVAGSRRLGGCG